ncbi:unnamed protein product [Porites evermanni]|uniref:Apolipoprotein L3 n=1 Tax=Porites evermanni TaxID=104178 RepID=A0ABN8LV38_9CNID|nr:unnamed protein product [Porites evermanni]
MARNKNLEKSVIELTESMQSGVEKRLETLETVRSLANELNEHDKNVHIAKVSGSSFSIAGFVLIAVGFGLAPVTLGTSTILSAVGGAMCAGGGTTAAGSSLLRNRIFKRKLAKAQEIIDADRQAQESVQKLLNELYREVSALSVGDALDGLRESSFNMTRGGGYNKNLFFFIKNLVDIGKLAKAGTRAATIAGSEGAEAVLRTIGIAGNAARIGGFAISAVLLPVDIYTLVTSAMKIKSHGVDEPEEVRKLKELAAELEREMNDMLEVVYELNSAHMEKDCVDVTSQCGFAV